MSYFESHFISSLYNSVSDFLGNPTLHKIKDSDDEYSFYGVQVYSENAKEKLFIICKTMKKPLKEIKLKELPWYSIQTRKINDRSEYDTLKKIHLQKNFLSTLKDIEIHNVNTNKNKNVTNYSVKNNDRIKISLLNSEDYYIPDKTNLQYLLNLFDTIILIEKKKMISF
jgi:hypothetical protein